MGSGGVFQASNYGCWLLLYLYMYGFVKLVSGLDFTRMTRASLFGLRQRWFSNFGVLWPSIVKPFIPFLPCASVYGRVWLSVHVCVYVSHPDFPINV